MEKRKTKKEIVKMLLNQDLHIDDETELMEILFDEPISIDVEKTDASNLKLGDKIADKLTQTAGSWGFIIGFVAFLIIWIVLNSVVFVYGREIDPYPFILLNLLLSCLSALQAPIIMMSQNRAAKKDSLRGKNDYRTDLKSELILEELHHQMSEILSNQKKILKAMNTDKIEEKNSSFMQ